MLRRTYEGVSRAGFLIVLGIGSLFVSLWVSSCSKADAADPTRLAKSILTMRRAQETAPTPTPTPTPEPAGDECPDCNGTGKLGDGTVFVRCQACNGTGKRTTAPPLEAPDEERPPLYPGDLDQFTPQGPAPVPVPAPTAARPPQTKKAAAPPAAGNCASGSCAAPSSGAMQPRPRTRFLFRLRP